MDSINKFEKMVEGWLKPLPHLPEKGRTWLANNVWWLALIGVIGSVLGAINMFYAASVASRYVNYVNDIYSAWGVSNPHSSGFLGLDWSLSLIISTLGLAAGAVLMAIAISPLKTKQKKGWDLMFLAMLVSVAVQLVGVLFDFGNLIGGVLSAAIGAAIGVYFLFEIKPYFKKAEAKKKA